MKTVFKKLDIVKQRLRNENIRNTHTTFSFALGKKERSRI